MNKEELRRNIAELIGHAQRLGFDVREGHQHPISIQKVIGGVRKPFVELALYLSAPVEVS